MFELEVIVSALSGEPPRYPYCKKSITHIRLEWEKSLRTQTDWKYKAYFVADDERILTGVRCKKCEFILDKDLIRKLFTSLPPRSRSLEDLYVKNSRKISRCH